MSSSSECTNHDATDSAVDVVHCSRLKLQRVAASLQEWVTSTTVVEQQPCRTIQETIQYRCKCTFQIIWIESFMYFAIRQNQTPVVITDAFPVANRRIQGIMTRLQTTLNDHPDDFGTVRRYLTSVGFSAAWKDTNDADCLVTLFYDHFIKHDRDWAIEAARLRGILSVTQVSGRSRQQLIRAHIDTPTSTTTNIMIRDTLWLLPSTCGGTWRVCLDDPSPHDDDADDMFHRTVRYEKPEGAFFHPNATAMCTALEWLIQRVVVIQHHRNDSESRRGTCRLLELYCGCGAHTVALMQTNILELIVAVELDERLVDACRRNVIINKCARESGTIVQVVSADAGVWAKTFVSRGPGKPLDTSDSIDMDRFDILLVDPPRQGLDANVCHMIICGSFTDVLYISCGKEALIRDLQRLSCYFQVADCKLIDLFPQTDAVESLLHLRRKTLYCK